MGAPRLSRGHDGAVTGPNRAAPVGRNQVEANLASPVLVARVRPSAFQRRAVLCARANRLRRASRARRFAGFTTAPAVLTRGRLRARRTAVRKTRSYAGCARVDEPRRLPWLVRVDTFPEAGAAYSDHGGAKALSADTIGFLVEGGQRGNLILQPCCWRSRNPCPGR